MLRLPLFVAPMIVLRVKMQFLCVHFCLFTARYPQALLVLHYFGESFNKMLTSSHASAFSK